MALTIGMALMGAMTAVRVASSIGQGYVQKAESDYNATVAEEQGKAIDFQADVDYAQFQRLKGKTLSTSIANVGAMGIGLGGSALAVMLDAQTQIGIDQAVSKFNIQQEKLYKTNEAKLLRIQGRGYRTAGYTNAFSSLLSGGAQYAHYAGIFNETFDDDQGAKKGGKA